MSYKKLICFDFDKTLFHTPEQIEGVKKWEKETGSSWQGRGWWGNAESLNTKIFDIPLNLWVYNHYKKYINDENNYVFLATGRLERLKSQVENILNIHEIKFNDVFCNTGRETLYFKMRLFEKIISENPKANEFIMFDDRHEHLTEFIKWAKSQKIKITIIDVINKKTITIND